jgi:hypothetical protein
VTEPLSSIPLKRDEKMGLLTITVGTGLVYTRRSDNLIGGVGKVFVENADPSELELRRVIAETLRRDEDSLSDEDVFAALMREVNRRIKSESRV